MKEEKRYTVGQMAELCHVSKRILRYYDQNGVLVPACRDKNTNYRYYTEKQIEEVLFLQELRELSLPVKTIGMLFPDRDLQNFEVELEQHLRQLRTEMAGLQEKYDRTLDVFLRVLRGRVSIEDVRKSPQTDVQMVHFHKRTVASVSRCGVWDLRRRHLSSRTELMKFLSDQGLRPVGSYMAVVHANRQSVCCDSEMMDLELIIEVSEEKNSRQCVRMDGFDAVSCVCIGPYEKLEGCYQEMERYAVQNNLKIRDMVVEEYLVGPVMTSNPDHYVTRLYLPVQV